MQTIGKMDDGRVLAALSQQEYGVLMAVDTMIEVRQIVRATIPPAAGPGVHGPDISGGPNGDMVPSDAKAPNPSRNLCRQSRVSPPPAAKIRLIRPISPNASAAGIPAKAHPWRAAMAAEVAMAASRKRAQPNREKICVICGDNFHDASNTNTRKVCKKQVCKIGLAKRQKEMYQAKRGKTTARSAAVTTMPPNPSDPFLTDEQRKEMMARREKLIAASAQKHAED